jgi:hypothetical protein
MSDATLVFDPARLCDTILVLLREHVLSAREDLRATLEGEATRIAERTAELGALALGGDPVARETLRDMAAQAASLAALVAMREQDRAVATMRAVAVVIVRALVLLASGAA